MTTELIKIFENGLKSNVDKVKGYGELFVKKYYNPNARMFDCTDAERLAHVFKKILDGDTTCRIVLDEEK